MQKISSREIFIFSFFLCCTMFVGFGNSYLIRTSGTTTLLTTLIGFIIGFVPILIMLYISKFTTDKNIFELLKSKFKGFGVLINTLLFLSILILGIVSIWNSLNFTVSQFLARTPYLLVGLVLFMIFVLTALKGVEIIGRTAIIFFTVFMLLSILSLLGLISKIQIDNIFPILNIKIPDFIKSVLMFPTYIAFPAFLLLSIRQNDIIDQHNFKKSVILGYIVSFIFLYIFGFFIISIFGIDLAKIYAYPEYSLFKQIRGYNFIEKIENLLSIIIFIAFFIFNAIGVFFTKEYYVSTFNLKKASTINIWVIISEAILIIGTILIFTKFQPIYLISKYYLFTIPIFILFLIVAILLFITKKRKT